MYYETELAHHGVGGMHWGKRNGPPYPLNALGKASLAKQKKHDAKIAAKEEARAAKKKRKDEKKSSKKNQNNSVPEKELSPEDIAIKKKQILESRNAALIYKNANLFSTSELQEARNRLNLEADIKRLAPADISKGEKYVKDMEKFNRVLKVTVDVSSNGINLYNNVAKVLNSDKSRTEKLPIIGQNDGKDKKKDK